VDKIGEFCLPIRFAQYNIVNLTVYSDDLLKNNKIFTTGIQENNTREYFSKLLVPRVVG